VNRADQQLRYRDLQYRRAADQLNPALLQRKVRSPPRLTADDPACRAPPSSFDKLLLSGDSPDVHDRRDDLGPFFSYQEYTSPDSYSAVQEHGVYVDDR